MKPAAAIEVERLSRAFRTPLGGSFVALQDVSLAVADGEFVSVIGPSGCGKSTLLRVLADVLPPTEGRVSVRGKTPGQARRDRDYSLVFQQPVLFDWRSVLNNVRLPLEMGPRTKHLADRGDDSAARTAEQPGGADELGRRAEQPGRAQQPGGRAEQPRGRAEGLLELVGLSPFARHQPWQLSGGMQQRVAIARALATRPSILLLDEPFGALDEITRDGMNAELLKLCEGARVTAVLVTHSIAEAVLLSDRVLVMGTAPGRIVGSIDVDLPRPRSVAVRDTPAFFELVTAVRRLLRHTPAQSAQS